MQCAVLWYSGLLSGRRLPWTLAAWLVLATGLSIGLRLAPHLAIDGAAFQALPSIPLFTLRPPVFELVAVQIGRRDAGGDLGKRSAIG